jgi:hypothetical protein
LFLAGHTNLFSHDAAPYFAIEDKLSPSASYDPVGNRLSSLGVSPYAMNTSNELTSTPNDTSTYDAKGNTLTKVDWNYELCMGFREPPHQRDVACVGRDRHAVTTRKH